MRSRHRAPSALQPSLRAGVMAGAAGTCALNAVTYLDMALRGRPSSSLPADAAEKITSEVGLKLGEGDKGDARKQAIGALLGYATGLGVGAAYGLARQRVTVPWPLAAFGLAAAAMLAGDAPMTALGLTDPRKWSASAWLSDAVPHAAYGLVGAYVFDRAFLGFGGHSGFRHRQTCCSSSSGVRSYMG